MRPAESRPAMRTFICPSGSAGSASADSGIVSGTFACWRPRSMVRCGLVVPVQFTTSRKRIVGARPFTWKLTDGVCPGFITEGEIRNADSCGRAATLEGFLVVAGFLAGVFAGALAGVFARGHGTRSPQNRPPVVVGFV